MLTNRTKGKEEEKDLLNVKICHPAIILNNTLWHFEEPFGGFL